MNADQIKIGEEFSQAGVKYRKTKDGIIRVYDDRTVSAPAGEVILEQQLLKG